MLGAAAPVDSRSMISKLERMVRGGVSAPLPEMRSTSRSTAVTAIELRPGSTVLGNEMDGPWQLGHSTADEYGSLAARAAGNEEPVTPEVVARGVAAYVEAVANLGGAQPGDKTIIDAAAPFRDELAAALGDGRAVPDAWAGAAAVATERAAATSALRPKLGRARPLAERSIGHPDPGALSFALCVNAVAEVLGEPANHPGEEADHGSSSGARG